MLLSTALVKPEGNATEGDLDGIYPHGRVTVHPSQQASTPANKFAGDPELAGDAFREAQGLAQRQGRTR